MITLNGTTGITTPDVTSDGSLKIDASAPDNSVVVDASGNVGIGTSPPFSRLRVKQSASDGFTDGLSIQRGTTSDTYEWVVGGDNGLYLGYANNASGADAPGDFSSRMVIDSSGNLQLGLTGGSARLNVSYSYPTTGANWFSDSTLSHYAITFNNAFGLAGSITTTSTSTAFNTSSDYRLKEDWVAVADASTRVNALKPVNFAWKADGKRVDGFLAHELAEVVPEAVTGEKDAVELVDIKDEDGSVTGQEERPVYQGIDQSKLVPLLTAALQEALAKIEDLTARVVALEGQP